MSKDFNISILMDFYGGLLTQKQVDALDCYYNQDYSLQEIAENMNISRQGARDFIKRGEKQLADFEDKLALAGKFARINALADKMAAAIEKLEKLRNCGESDSGDSGADIITDMKNILADIRNSL